LDTGQARVNYYHRPERLLHPPDDEPEPADTGKPQPFHPVGDDDADQLDEPEHDDTGDSVPPDPIGDGGCREPQPIDPVSNDDADQPGGPAPPDDQAA
jgi:hypothetical protein